MSSITSLDYTSAPRVPTGHPQGALATLLAQVDVRLDGARPWDIRVHDPRLSKRVLMQGSLGGGESYMDGWWDCQRLDEMLARILSANVDGRLGRLHERWAAMVAFIRNGQTKRRAFRVGERHYDLGDDLYESMLDERLIYSCGYWRNATTLE